MRASLVFYLFPVSTTGLVPERHYFQPCMLKKATTNDTDAIDPAHEHPQKLTRDNLATFSVSGY